MNENRPRRRAAAAQAAQATRKTSKKARVRRSKLNSMLTTVALMLLVAVVSIGGTMAWLQDSKTVTNTFAPSNIGLELTETWNHDSDGDGTEDSWQIQMIPGEEHKKDPKVKITNDVDAWLFVEMDKSIENLETYLDYTFNAEGWTQGNAENGVPANVYYREVAANASPNEWNLLTGDKVTVKSSVTKDNMTALSNQNVTLSFTAYAIQKSSFATAQDAWNQLNPTNP